MNHQFTTNHSILMLSIHGYVSAKPELGKPDTGGQVVYVLELAKRFSRLGRRVDLVTRRFENQPEFDIVNKNFRIWRIPFGGEGFIRKEDMHDYLPEFVSNFLAPSDGQRPHYDLVYSHYWDAGVAGQKIAEELGIPHVHTPHSLGSWKQKNMGMDMNVKDMEKKYRFEERIRKEFLAYRSCDHIIATTEQQSEILQEDYDVLSRQVSIIPPGIDENRFSPMRQKDIERLRKKYDLRGHDVLVVGRMAANKGYDLMIQSMPTLINLVPDARLIAAIGSEESIQDDQGVLKLQQLAKELGVNDHIVWEKYIPEENLADYYRAAGVFALPSRYEPFGMVAVEAMACGTPTVVTVHGGLGDLFDFGSQALFAAPDRPQEFGAILALPLLYPNLSMELSVEGARFARKNFGWTGIARRILDIFDSVRKSPATLV